MRKLILIALALCPAFAQEYVAICDSAALSSTAAVCTVQSPATNYATVRFAVVTISSTVATTLTIERNGSAASATSITPAPLNPTSPSARTTAFNQSNSTGGTVIGKHRVAAGGSISVALDGLVMNGANQNLTIRTAAVTGDVTILMQWREERR